MSVNQNTGLKGMDIVLGNLNREFVKMKSNSASGMLEAAALIRVDMQKTPPLVPVDFGNLNSSWFVKSFRTMGSPAVVIGFSANYATAVHEMVDRKIEWKRPGSGPKFLEAALNRNKKAILNLIANKTKIV